MAAETGDLHRVPGRPAATAEAQRRRVSAGAHLLGHARDIRTMTGTSPASVLGRAPRRHPTRPATRADRRFVASLGRRPALGAADFVAPPGTRAGAGRLLLRVHPHEDVEASPPENWTPCAGTSPGSPRPVLRADTTQVTGAVPDVVVTGTRGARCILQSASRLSQARGCAASRDSLRVESSLAVGWEHRGAVLANEVLPLLWGEIAALFLTANSRCA